MRYILNDNGYIQAVSFNNILECQNKTCTEYTGTVPTGYETLAEWSENANINAYKIVNGNLTYDSEEDARLQALWESQLSNSGASNPSNTIDTLPIGSIFEYEGDTIPNGFEEVTDDNAYSTEEQVIGKWIDDKPIYRKVIQHGLIGTTNPKTYVFTGNYKYIINESHCFVGTAGGVVMLPVLTKDDSLFAKVNSSISGSTGALTLELQRTGGDYWSEWILCSIIEYTKTTD